MIKLKKILLEIFDGETEEEQEQIDKDELYWSDNYLDDVAEQMGYKDNFNENFWRYPRPLYHCTPPENVESIQQNGIDARSSSRGITNRSVGQAVFTTMEREEVEHLKSSYGSACFVINTKAMKQDGYTPDVSREPEWERAYKLHFVLSRLGEDSEPARYVDSSDGVSEYTVIIHGRVPAKYLSLSND